MIKLAIYGIESVDTFRYNSFIFNKTFIGRCSNTIHLYVEDNIDQNTIKLFKQYFDFVIVKKVLFFNSNKIKDVLSHDKINFLIINSFTAGDFRIINSIGDSSIFLLYIQHGLYLEYMKRNINFFINNFKRALSSLYYVADITSWNLMKSYDIASVYLSGKNRSVISKELRSKTSLNMVLSEYWKQFHIESYKINSEYFIAGFLDLLKFKSKPVDGIVYCSQTLVEDGRIDKLTMLNFYQELYDFGNKLAFKIFVKTHPRNSKWTIDIFKSFKFSIFTKEIPIGIVTIGHYSSLLPIWSINKCPIIIFELKKHPTPESISNLSSLTIQTLKNIDIQTLNILEVNKKAVEYFGDIPIQQNINNNILKSYENTILSPINR
jgi:hypothetical protein